MTTHIQSTICLKLILVCFENRSPWDEEISCRIVYFPSLELSSDNIKQPLRCIHTWRSPLIWGTLYGTTENCACMMRRGEMIEISALPGSVTKVIHWHYTHWPLLELFCWNVNTVFCLSLFKADCWDQPALLFCDIILFKWISLGGTGSICYITSAIPSINSWCQRALTSHSKTKCYLYQYTLSGHFIRYTCTI